MAANKHISPKSSRVKSYDKSRLKKTRPHYHEKAPLDPRSDLASRAFEFGRAHGARSRISLH